MYARQVAGQTLTFGVSGKLIMNALVMYDRQTDSLWSQFLGVSVRGPLEGASLEPLSSSLVTWEAWRTLHPDTVVLDQGRRRGDPYDSYYSGDSTGVVGTSAQDERLGRKEFVLGLQLAGGKKAYPYRTLTERPVVNDTVGGRAVVITFDAASGASSAFDRTHRGRALTFEAIPPASAEETPVMVDRETGSVWSRLSGVALSGELVGEQLAALPSFQVFWFAWVDFHPDSEFYEPGG